MTIAEKVKDLINQAEALLSEAADEAESKYEELHCVEAILLCEQAIIQVEYGLLANDRGDVARRVARLESACHGVGGEL